MSESGNINASSDAYFSDATASISNATIEFDGFVDFQYEGPEASLKWNFGDNTTGTLPNVRHYYYNVNTYNVSLIAEKSTDCFKDFSLGTITVSGENISPYTGMETETSTISIFPIPAKNTLYIKSPDKIIQLKLSSISGNTVIQLHPNKLTEELDVSYLPSGLYVVTIMTTRGYQYHKIIKE